MRFPYIVFLTYGLTLRFPDAGQGDPAVFGELVAIFASSFPATYVEKDGVWQVKGQHAEAVKRYCYKFWGGFKQISVTP